MTDETTLREQIAQVERYADRLNPCRSAEEEMAWRDALMFQQGLAWALRGLAGGCAMWDDVRAAWKARGTPMPGDAA